MKYFIKNLKNTLLIQIFIYNDNKQRMKYLCNVSCDLIKGAHNCNCRVDVVWPEFNIYPRLETIPQILEFCLSFCIIVAESC